MATTSSTALTSSDKRQRLLRAFAYYAAYVVLGLALSALGPTLPALAGQTSSTLSQISILFTANSLGYIVGSLLGSRLYDRRPGQPILAVTLTGMALLIFAIPVIPNRWLLVTDFALIGLGMGVLDVGGNTLIVWLFGREVGPYMNALHLSFGVGAFLSPILIDRVVVLTGGIRWAYWALALLIVPVAYWMTRIPSPVRSDEETVPGAPVKARTPAYALLVLMIAMLMFMHVGAELSFGGWIFSYAVATGIGPETTARLLNSLYWGALAAGRLIAVPLAIRLQPRAMLLLDLIGMVVSIGIIAFFPQWPPAVWIGTLGFGIFIASMFATTINFTDHHMPITGSVTGFLLVGANVGSMTLPWVIGQFFESVGPQVMVTIIGLDVVAALVLFGVILLYVRRLPARHMS